MKKTLLFLLLIAVTGIAQAQIINFPDANFKAKLLQASTLNTIAYGNGGYMNIDGNYDGEIQVSEAMAVDSLNIHLSNIFDLNGISNFSNLKKLSCVGNNITSFDATSLSNLEVLHCGANYSMNSLNVSGLNNLKILYSESTMLTTLDLSGLFSLEKLVLSYNNISSLNVAGLTALKYIDCHGCSLTALDLSGLIHLETVRLIDNELTAINLDGLSSLKFLYLEDNELATLDINSSPNLVDLYCQQNNLTSLSLTGMPNLTYLDCGYNFQLSSLNMVGLPSLTSLLCQSNNLTVLNFDGVPNLGGLICFNNHLTTLDVSGLNDFEYLDCKQNELTNLYIKNGRNEHTLHFDDNPNLTFICADDSQVAYVQNKLNIYGMSNTVVNSYCSFNPGGNYNTITGTVLFDADGNGCTTADLPQSFVKVKINDGTTNGSTFVDSVGHYSFYTLAGSFVITPEIESPSFFTINPLDATVNFADSNNNTAIHNFCIAPNGVHPDVEIVIVPVGAARPGFDAIYKIVYKNKGNQVLSGAVDFNYNDAVLDYVSASVVPSSQNTGVVNWNYSNLMPFENKEIIVTLNANGPMETPPVNIGDVLSFSASVNPVLSDETPADNTFNYNETVVGSFDPNDKQCVEGNIVDLSKIGDYLHYVIRFENTGTAAAENIVVKDMIDTAKFDIATLQVLNASHPVATKITGNKTEFIFENINLASNAHGNVTFKIKTKNTLVGGDVVTNKADIFFDYNFPVVTNLASTLFQSLGTEEFKKDDSVLVYPNPAANLINIKADGLIKSVQLFDVQGRILVSTQVQESQMSFDVSRYSNAVYFLKIVTEKGIKIERIVKK